MTSTDLSPAPLAPGAEPQDVVDQITAAAKSSFSLGMKLLSAPRRRAMRAVYAFCRVVDDIADGELPTAEKKALLAEWRAEIDKLYHGHPVSAIGQALIAPVADHDLPRAEFLKMIEGMEMDADGPIVAPSMAELRRYNRCVAGSVGMLSMRIFGAWRDEISERLTLTLAHALQTTNILRDVEEDAAIGRIYLPAEVLASTGVAADPGTIATDPNLPRACELLGHEAKAAFAVVRAAVPRHNRRAVAPALAMYGVYHAYLQRIEAAGGNPIGLPSMGRGEKLRHGLGAVLLTGWA